jgi:hypothetical protein
MRLASQAVPAPPRRLAQVSIQPGRVTEQDLWGERATPSSADQSMPYSALDRLVSASELPIALQGESSCTSLIIGSVPIERGL